MTDATRLQALAGGSSPRFEGNATPYRAGFYQMKLVKGGIFVPVRLWQGFGKQDGRELDDDGAPTPVIARGWIWRAMLDGVEVHPWKVWPDCSGEPITEEEYRFLLARRHHAMAHDPQSPFASPRQKVDWLTVKHNIPDLKGPTT